jgi:hypothetical protein
MAIGDYLDNYNNNPEPCVWNANASLVCRRSSVTRRAEGCREHEYSTDMLSPPYHYLMTKSGNLSLPDFPEPHPFLR